MGQRRGEEHYELVGEPWKGGWLHAGTIIRAMKQAAGEKIDGIEGEQDGYRAQMGFLFERALEIAWKEFWGVERSWVKNQLKLKMDGILMTPDGFDEENTRLESYK